MWLVPALAACGSAAPGQMLTAASQDMAHFHSYRVSGTLYFGEDRISISADVLSGGDINGYLVVRSVPSAFIVAHNVSYFEALSPAITSGADPTLQPILAGLHQPWWQAEGSSAVRAALAVVTPRGFSSQFLSDKTGLVESSARDGRGRPATALTGAPGTVLVSSAGSAAFLEVRSAAHYITSNNLTKIDLTVDHVNERLSVSAPATALKLNDLDSLPQYFAVKAGTSNGCDLAGCTAHATVIAAVGHGASTVHLTLISSEGTELAACSTPVSIAARNQSAEVSCRATGSAWTNWIRTNPTDTFTVRASADNPAYNFDNRPNL